MSEKEALELLIRFNAWRRGDVDEMPDPGDIGEAIDFAIMVLEQSISELTI